MSDDKIYAARSTTTGEVILIKWRERGFWPFKEIDARAFNDRHGHTSEEVAAAVIGSMFGWDVPGARPEVYTATEAEVIIGYTERDIGEATP